MLIWGSGGETEDLGCVETKHCETCERERPFKLFLQYKFSHIWYLFKWVSQKQYMLLCDVCCRGAKLDTKKVESSLDKNPIPFGTRYGWTFLVGLSAIGIAFAMFDSHEREINDNAFISAPRANDLYVINLAKMLKSPQSPYMYGVMKVHGVHGDWIDFLVSNVSYNQATGATKDISSAKAATGDYYGTDTLSIPIPDLKAMRQDGTINSVHRLNGRGDR